MGARSRTDGRLARRHLVDGGSAPRHGWQRRRGVLLGARAALAVGLLGLPLVAQEAQETQELSLWAEYKARKAALRDGSDPDALELEAFHARLLERVADDAHALRRACEVLSDYSGSRPLPELTSSAWPEPGFSLASGIDVSSEISSCLSAALPDSDAEWPFANVLAEWQLDGHDEALAAQLQKRADRLQTAVFIVPRALQQILNESSAERTLEERRELVRVATCASAALGGGSGLASLEYDWVRELRSLGRRSEALDVCGTALGRAAGTKLEPYLLLAKAELTRSLGRLDEALLDLEALEDLTAGEDPDRESVRSSIPGVRGHIFLELGLPERAGPLILEELALAEALPRNATNAPRLVTARDYALKYMTRTGDHEGVVERVQQFLQEEDLYGSRPEKRADLLYLMGQTREGPPSGEVSIRNEARPSGLPGASTTPTSLTRATVSAF